MPLEGDAPNVVEYKMPINGVNLNDGRLEIQETQALQLKNLIVRGGIKKRDGYAKRVATVIKAGTNIVTLIHRFYLQDGTSQLIVAAGDTLAKQNGTSWSNIDTNRTDDLPINATTWGAVDKVFFADGTNAGSQYDGTTFTNSVTGLSGIVPTQFLEYQDRLLMISETEPGVLRWSDSFDPTNWVSAAATGVRPDSKLYGMIIHNAADNQEQGQNAQVLLAGASGMYLFSGTNLSLTFSNYTIQQLATKTGCTAPKTMQWTPMGTTWLGTDGQVYLLPFESLVPIPIGENIRSKISGFTGLDSLSSTTVNTARAVYHDGFYKLTIPGSGSVINNEQWWLDVFSAFNKSNSQSIVNRALSIGWFGPMTGMTFSEMHSMTGAGDFDDLVAGEGDSSVGAFVYDINDLNLDDDGTAIPYNWISWYNPISSPFLDTVAHHIELELLNTNNTMLVAYRDSAGGASDSTSNITIAGTGSIYNEVYYGEVYYGGLDQTRIREGIVPPLKQRFVALDLSGEASVKVEIYAFRLEEAQQNMPFDDRR